MVSRFHEGEGGHGPGALPLCRTPASRGPRSRTGRSAGSRPRRWRSSSGRGCAFREQQERPAHERPVRGAEVPLGCSARPSRAASRAWMEAVMAGPAGPRGSRRCARPFPGSSAGPPDTGSSSPSACLVLSPGRPRGPGSGRSTGRRAARCVGPRRPSGGPRAARDLRRLACGKEAVARQGVRVGVVVHQPLVLVGPEHAPDLVSAAARVSGPATPSSQPRVKAGACRAR